jgi:hypothetical protein
MAVADGQRECGHKVSDMHVYSWQAIACMCRVVRVIVLQLLHCAHRLSWREHAANDDAWVSRDEFFHLDAKARGNAESKVVGLHHVSAAGRAVCTRVRAFTAPPWQLDLGARLHHAISNLNIQALELLDVDAESVGDAALNNNIKKS